MNNYYRNSNVILTERPCVSDGRHSLRALVGRARWSVNLHWDVKYMRAGEQRIIIKSSRSIRPEMNDQHKALPSWVASVAYTTMPASHSLGSDIMTRKACEARTQVGVNRGRTATGRPGLARCFPAEPLLELSAIRSGRTGRRGWDAGRRNLEAARSGRRQAYRCPGGRPSTNEA